MNDAPEHLISYFRLERGAVRWATHDELRRDPDRPPNARLKKFPDGLKAGSRPVHGHGLIVLCSGRQLLTADIAWAVPENWWPWNVAPNPPNCWLPEPDDAEAAELVRNTWELGEAGLVWRIQPHREIPAGSPVKGTFLAGRGDAAVSRKLKLYVSTDIRHVLEHGVWPWQHQWD